jgi:hypothetical protein
MRIHTPFWHGIQAATAAGLVLCFVPACKPAAAPVAPAKPAAPKPSAATFATTNAPLAAVSAFDQLMPPKGRDPFFPNSHRRDPQIAKGSPTEKPLASELLLKGVVGSANNRLALVNDDIFKVGEIGTVKVPGGHVEVKILEIGEDYAVIKVTGELETKRLQLSKKGL